MGIRYNYVGTHTTQFNQCLLLVLQMWNTYGKKFDNRFKK
jgi:hypothetical protein